MTPSLYYSLLGLWSLRTFQEIIVEKRPGSNRATAKYSRSCHEHRILVGLVLMSRGWYHVRTFRWWAVSTVVFLILELSLRVRLGAIFVLASAWALGHQWLSVKIGQEGAHSDGGMRFFAALYTAFWVCLLIFGVFSVLNIGLRTIDPGWRWFQLP